MPDIALPQMSQLMEQSPYPGLAMNIETVADHVLSGIRAREKCAHHTFRCGHRAPWREGVLPLLGQRFGNPVHTTEYLQRCRHQGPILLHQLGMLLQLGDDVLATGLLGGHMGAYMAELMDADGVKNDFVPIAGETRICLNILHEGNQTELLESGPQIAPAELEAFTAKFAELAAKADVVTLSGSLPRGVDAGYYAELVKIAEEAGAKVLLDTSGASLEAALESDAKPELVKPNLTEINGLLGTSFTTDDVDALREALAADDRFAGIPWVVVSMGAAGSVGFHEGRAFRAKTPAIAAVNATGSGDSTIAGFAHAIAAGADDVTVLKTANTCGKLNAMDPKTGHLVMDRWDEVYNSVEVTEL